MHTLGYIYILTTLFRRRRRKKRLLNAQYFGTILRLVLPQILSHLLPGQCPSSPLWLPHPFLPISRWVAFRFQGFSLLETRLSERGSWCDVISSLSPGVARLLFKLSTWEEILQKVQEQFDFSYEITPKSHDQSI